MSSGNDQEHLMFNHSMLRWSSQQSTMEYPNNPSMEITPATIVPSSSHNRNTSTMTPLPAINTTNPAMAPPPPVLDPTKQYHPEWGVIKEQDFHPLTLKHQRDLENLYSAGSAITDFYFWQANLGGYCMADMAQGIVVSSEGAFVLERKIVEGAPHPGRRKKKRGLG
ncbi:uncharacterized protein B0P05DRAFT_545333 [Gilbertella persicaria]|uniref:uncharacterized protein n=1 Tax=Gilbertella persicaria TaxID=101096 RepID=UPI00221FAAE2|nr:uncharacterized protein B0P05DRAFT_545333 [Gilbertella persicaria]KAI8076650.1 hypothetical protein B0P05DRAFT_545333 [Gilbertella persicaria]